MPKHEDSQLDHQSTKGKKPKELAGEKPDTVGKAEAPEGSQIFREAKQRKAELDRHPKRNMITRMLEKIDKLEAKIRDLRAAERIIDKKIQAIKEKSPREVKLQNLSEF